MTAAQQSLGLNTPKIELSRFVTFNENPNPHPVRVQAGGGRRSMQIGISIGVISLKHANGYEVLVEFPDGKIESFAPLSLFPVTQ